MPTNDKVKAERILEINPNHELFKALKQIYESDPAELKDYAFLLYNQALLMYQLFVQIRLLVHF